MAAKGKRIAVVITKGRRLVKHANGTWYLETCIQGIQKRRTLGTSDLKVAMEVQAKLKDAGAELPTAAPEPEQPKEDPASLTLQKGLDAYTKWYGENNRSVSLERTEPILKAFVAALGPNRDPKTITRDDVQKWIMSRRSGRSPATVRGDFTRVRALIYWLSDMKDAADRKACRRIDLPKMPRSAKPAPSVEKVRAVLRTLDAMEDVRYRWIADYARVLSETGMRPSELLGIRGNDLGDAVDQDGKPMKHKDGDRVKTLRIAPTDARELKTEASARTILLTPTAGEILQRRKDGLFKKDLPMFPNEMGEVYKANSALHIFKDALAGKRHGKPAPELNMSLYDFRHFFCSEHAAAGPQHMTMEALGAYVGHSAASTQTLSRFYIDQRALLRGAPVSIMEQKAGEVVELKAAKGK